MIRALGTRNVYHDIPSTCWPGGPNLIPSFLTIHGRATCHWMDAEDKRKQWLKGSTTISDTHTGEKFLLRTEKTSLLSAHTLAVRRLLPAGPQERLCEQRRAPVMRLDGRSPLGVSPPSPLRQEPVYGTRPAQGLGRPC